MMIKKWLVTCMMTAFACVMHADALDSLQLSLQKNVQVQEKVYLHLDNTVYFVGDTLWYRAYVLRADDHRTSPLSKLLYVELLSPDGLLVERQCVIVDDKQGLHGQFVLKDSLYSGYYELRAYTRWMLNFNVSERNYTRDDRHKFYNNQMAKDFFREWEGLYSRVVPVYSKPETAGDYSGKYMYERPKQEMPRRPKERLRVNFYPEGGQLVTGVPNRVAFEVTDQYGQAQEVSGSLADGTPLRATHQGKGLFSVTPSGQKMEARFQWKGKEYAFPLPKTVGQGVAMRYDAQGRQVVLQATSGLAGRTYGVAVTCRGRLISFQKVTLKAAPLSLKISDMPTGVNEIILFDDKAQPVASRLFFCNNYDAAGPLDISLADNTDLQPYQSAQLSVQTEPNSSFALAVRDAHTDDPTYDNGNFLTEMLLSSDVKGFIPNAAYYFESDDAQHQSDLDLLLMVQGWRRYQSAEKLRYAPERSLSVEGSVHRMLGMEILDINDVAEAQVITGLATQMSEDNLDATGFTTGETFTETPLGADQEDAAAKADSEVEEPDMGDDVTTELGVNHGSLRHEVLVEAELVGDGETVGAVQETQRRGHFVFELPPYYGTAILFLKAYEKKDSARKSMASRRDTEFMREDTYADFYVKRDLFYPVFTHPFSYYQNHRPDYVPEILDTDDVGTSEGDSKLDGDHTLSTVDVKARRRGRRGIDYTKPAFVIDAYDLYNDATDRGLSWGLANMGKFPPLACFTIFGNMDKYKDFNVRAKIDNYTFYQNFTSIDEPIRNRSNERIFKDLHLNRIQNVRLYTDYDLRNPDSLHSQSVNREDITLVYETIPNDGKRYSYRDRRYILPGIAMPADFYQPNYADAQPAAPTDYRRTLCWIPNAQADATGHFSTTFYNNSRPTRIKISAAGITPSGKIIAH